MSGRSCCSSAKSPEKVCVCFYVVAAEVDSMSPAITEQEGWDERTEEKKKDQGVWQPETQRVEHQGCQRQGGPLALNGSLVRKVEREEAQIKDVPSLRRKSSHPSLLNGRLKLRKTASKGGRSMEGASAILPGCHTGGGGGYCSAACRKHTHNKLIQAHMKVSTQQREL